MVEIILVISAFGSLISLFALFEAMRDRKAINEAMSDPDPDLVALARFNLVEESLRLLVQLCFVGIALSVLLHHGRNQNYQLILMTIPPIVIMFWSIYSFSRETYIRSKKGQEEEV